MSVSLWQTAMEQETPPTRVDVAVIGAGIIGAYLALRVSARR